MNKGNLAMTLVLNEEQLMLKESAQGFLAECAPVSELRKQRDAGSETGYADDLWPEMVNMGWAAVWCQKPWWPRIWPCGYGSVN